MQGSKRQEQHISGGGGGGSSLGGAVAGYVIAGGVGAVIGSRKKAESIQTEYVNVDDRKLVLTMTDNTTKSYPYQYYEYMLKMVPEKDYDVYIANLKSKGLNN